MRVRRRMLPSRVGCGSSAARRRLTHAYTSPETVPATGDLLARLRHVVRIDAPVDDPVVRALEAHRSGTYAEAVAASSERGR
jgi:hypothetical protein